MRAHTARGRNGLTSHGGESSSHAKNRLESAQQGDHKGRFAFLFYGKSGASAGCELPSADDGPPTARCWPFDFAIFKPPLPHC